MKKNGFTLIEMLLVLAIIGSLLFLIVPNLTVQKSNADIKSCNAYIELVRTQMQLYELDNDVIPTVQDLVDNNYIKSTACPNGKVLTIIGGEVVEQPST